MNPDGTASIKLVRRDGGCSWALIDQADLHLVAPYRWYEARRSHTTYVEATVNGMPRRVKVYMHRVVIGDPATPHVDHRDGDGLNNTRANLRPATVRENRRNETADREHTSAYRGVSWSEDAGGWIVRCGIGTRHLYLGTYDTESEAALVYDEAAREHFGEFASVNFTPEEAAGMPRPKRRRRKTRDDLAHGTRGRYKYCGCRCEPCREAENGYQRERYARIRAAA